jgi:hypothetical protein
MSVTKRKNDVNRAQILRRRVARLSCCLVSSGAPEGDVVGSTAVSSDFRRRLNMPMFAGIVVGVVGVVGSDQLRDDNEVRGDEVREQAMFAGR